MAYQKSSTFYWRRKKIGKEIKKIDSLEIILTKINNTCEIYNLFQVEIQTQKKILLPLLSPSFSNTKAKHHPQKHTRKESREDSISNIREKVASW